MSVLHIVNEKGRDVVSVSRSRTIADVVTTLTEKRIGAVVVLEDDNIMGIISERDIIRVLAEQGASGLSRTVGECMTSKVVTCALTDSLDRVMQTMTTGRFRHLPVVEDGRIVGIVSIGDVVKRRISEVEREANSIRDYIATA
jgi:CBS domain-containing protein